jgi:hypothetical protein
VILDWETSLRTPYVERRYDCTHNLLLYHPSVIDDTAAFLRNPLSKPWMVASPAEQAKLAHHHQD